MQINETLHPIFVGALRPFAPALFPKAETTFVNPPIPVRSHDWSATLEGYEPGDAQGTGATERDALNDLFDKLADEYRTGLDKVGEPWEDNPRRVKAADE
jgi:hypothetical protein